MPYGPYKLKYLVCPKRVLQNRMALDLLLASQGGVCTVINTSFCVSVDQSSRISMHLAEIWEHTKILHEVTKDNTSWGFEDLWHKLTSWLPHWTWLKNLFVIIIVLISVCILACIMIQCCSCCSQMCMRIKFRY